jgi:hypothetical protein
MCGRYRLSRRKQLVEEYFDTVPSDEEWAQRYNIAPANSEGKLGSYDTNYDTKQRLARRDHDVSYGKDWSGREDLNLRPPGPEPGALPG